jgi:phosphatidylinositol alpha-1,6-mannosyltransferase
MKQDSSKTVEPIRHLVMADAALPHSGGSRVYYANLYKNLLIEYPDTVTLLTKKVPGWEEFDRNQCTDRFLVIRRFRPLPNWRYDQLPKALPQFVHASGTMIRGRYDCLHCGDLFPQAFNGVFLKKIFHIPLLIFCHGDEISQTDRRHYQPKVRDFIYHQADAIVAANQFAYDGLVRIGIPQERLYKLLPGVETQYFQPRPPDADLIQRYGLSNCKVLLTVARLVPRKNHKVVLQALPTVLKQVPNLKYLIAGDGPEKKNLQKMVQELALGHVVIFAGDIPHGKISDYYNLCHVFIMTNRLEPGGDVESFGMVFIEANALGKPVIGGRSGGAAESIVDGTTGFLVDPDDPVDVGERLLQLLKNEDLAMDMGIAGWERVKRDFDWTTRAHELRRIAAGLVSESRTPGQTAASGKTPKVQT